jgi:hypothetical protein
MADYAFRESRQALNSKGSWSLSRMWLRLPVGVWGRPENWLGLRASVLLDVTLYIILRLGLLCAFFRSVVFGHFLFREL